MSFSAETKKQLARQMSHNRCCQVAEFLALMKNDGTLRIGGNHVVSLVIATANPAVAGKIFRLAKALFNDPGRVVTYRTTKLKKQKVYEIVIPAQEELAPLFAALGLGNQRPDWAGDLRDEFPWDALAKSCCRRSYLRGAFLGSGSVSSPDGAYHLEIVCERQSSADSLRRLLVDFGLHANIYRRKNQYVLYLKDAEQIAEFLSQIGAHGARLTIENHRIRKEIYNNINRKNNFDMANVDKTIRSSIAQRAAIEKIDASIGLEQLPVGLEEVARLRLEQPEATLAELAAMIEPPLSKSGVSHRLRKIEKIAEDL